MPRPRGPRQHLHQHLLQAQSGSGLVIIIRIISCNSSSSSSSSSRIVINVGSFASQDFDMFLCDLCESLAEICGDYFPLQNDQQVMWRFAETTDPRKNYAE